MDVRCLLMRTLGHFDTLVTISVGLCAVDDLGAEYQELIMEDQHRVSISA